METTKRQEAVTTLFEGFRALGHLIPTSGLVPTELVRDMLGSIGLALQAAGCDDGAEFSQIEDLAEACGERMPVEVARGLVSLARWIGGDRPAGGGSEEVAS